MMSWASHSTYDLQVRYHLRCYVERCLAHLRPGGKLIFESQTPL
jgi:hypothetical protein